jgi:hypothetical protein
VLEVDVGGSPRPAVVAGKVSSSSVAACSRLPWPAVVARGELGVRICNFLWCWCRCSSWCGCFSFEAMLAVAAADASAGVRRHLV